MFQDWSKGKKCLQRIYVILWMLYKIGICLLVFHLLNLNSAPSLWTKPKALWVITGPEEGVAASASTWCHLDLTHKEYLKQEFDWQPIKDTPKCPATKVFPFIMSPLVFFLRVLAMFCCKTDGVVRAVSRAGVEAPGLGTCAEALSLSSFACPT